MYSNSWMVNDNVVHVCDGVLCSCKEKQMKNFAGERMALVRVILS